jgi:hypothetical protein
MQEAMSYTDIHARRKLTLTAEGKELDSMDK